jgi:hypothetical protein
MILHIQRLPVQSALAATRIGDGGGQRVGVGVCIGGVDARGGGEVAEEGGADGGAEFVADGYGVRVGVGPGAAGGEGGACLCERG